MSAAGAVWTPAPPTGKPSRVSPPLDLRFQPFGDYLVLGKGKRTAHG
jgi:hypothetical protein